MFLLQNFHFYHRTADLFQLLSSGLPTIHMSKLPKSFMLCIVLTLFPMIPLLFPMSYPFCLTSSPLPDAHDEFTGSN